MFMRIVLFYILVIFGFNVFGAEDNDLNGFVNEEFYKRCHEVEKINNTEGKDIKDFQYVGGEEEGQALKKDYSGIWAIFEVTKNENTKIYIYVKNINSIFEVVHNNTFVNYGLFKDCSNIRSIKVLCCNTNDVDNMSSMFKNCSSLTNLQDISKWKTDNVFDMGYMFDGCSSLTSLPDISKWNTSQVINMCNMFSRCSSLSSLPDISNWDTEKVVKMSNMFSRCSSLYSLPDISKWDTENVRDMKYMFYNCSKLKELPAIYKWDTRNLKYSDHMFDGCPGKDCSYNINSYFYKISCCIYLE